MCPTDGGSAMDEQWRYPTDDRRPPRPEPAGGGGRVLALLVVAILAVTTFLGFRAELPQWGPFADPEIVDATYSAEPLPTLDLPAVSAAVRPALVHISTSSRPFGLGAAGSGIVLTGDGQVLTSHHVVKGADTVTVTDVGNGEVYQATVLGYDSGADIALLELRGATDLPTAAIGNSGDVRMRDEVLAIGNAGGVGGTPTAIPGTITNLDSTIVALNSADLSRKALSGMFEVAAPVSSGQSGGALADRKGAIIGVITAASGDPDQKSAEGANGYAVPIDRAMRVVRQIRSGTPTDTVHVGPTATIGVIASNAQPPGSGARVEAAIFGMPAHAAGLLEGEVITALDDQPVTTTQSLQSALNLHRPNETVTLLVTGPHGNRAVPVLLVVGPPN
ncbi:trypsin-like peptidase domain-containing protein [Nocardia sp. NPDC048505]|uniref:S1C family serine protease n=1 Tax=unclassified Nocardia TaxID=2637762 RepID=UPI0033E31FD6